MSRKSKRKARKMKKRLHTSNEGLPSTVVSSNCRMTLSTAHRHFSDLTPLSRTFYRIATMFPPWGPPLTGSVGIRLRCIFIYTCVRHLLCVFRLFFFFLSDLDVNLQGPRRELLCYPGSHGFWNTMSLILFLART